MDEDVKNFVMQNRDEHKEIINSINLVSEKVESAKTFSNSLKTIITILLSILVVLLGSITYFSKVSYTSMKESTNAQLHLNSILDSINYRIKESNAVAKNFNAKSITDSIQKHWLLEKEFYNGEFKRWTNWTKKVWRDEIVPANKRSKKNELVLKDHENRLRRLEQKEGIKSQLK